ncbi:MAG: type II secretion system protein [Planctomycetes bacterium]|nr:type II secretion system protein [Planctomycetota bacterium]
MVELLVVISIITILAALLLPVISKAMYVARDMTCMNHHRQIMLGIGMYAGDYDGYVPANDGSGGSLYMRAYTLCAGTANEHSYPNHYSGIGRLLELNYVSGTRLFWCGNEVSPKERLCSEYGSDAKYGWKGFEKTPPSLSFESDLWYRCGWVNEKNISEKLGRITQLDDGVLMCGLSFGEKWLDLHQGRGFNLTFADGHVSFYSLDSLIVPPTYNMFAMKSTLTSASHTFRQ